MWQVIAGSLYSNCAGRWLQVGCTFSVMSWQVIAGSIMETPSDVTFKPVRNGDDGKLQAITEELRLVSTQLVGSCAELDRLFIQY